MIQVFVAQHPTEAHLVAELLKSGGIETEVRGEALFAARGFIPVSSATLPSVWVDDAQADEARQILSTKSPELPAGPDPDRQVAERWYARPVFFVSDLNRSIEFYVDRLGFVKKWHEADGTGTVCQVDHGECEIILCQDSNRSDKSRLFVELTKEGVAELRREIAAREVPHKLAWWGYDVIQIDDPDGNELLFPTTP